MNKYNPQDLYVNMQDVIGDLAHEHGIPIISFDNLVKLGQRVVIIYGLDHLAKRITFDVMCSYIAKYIQTPFGKQVLEDILTCPDVKTTHRVASITNLQKCKDLVNNEK